MQACKLKEKGRGTVNKHMLLQPSAGQCSTKMTPVKDVVLPKMLSVEEILTLQYFQATRPVPGRISWIQQDAEYMNLPVKFSRGISAEAHARDIEKLGTFTAGVYRWRD